MTRKKVSLRQELPLLIWLVLVWAALWRDFSPGNLIVGAIVAAIVGRVFYLPPVQLSGRFNVWYFAIFLFIFVWRVIVASGQVISVIVRRGPRVRNAVVAVPLHSHADLIITLTGHLVSLVPGSLVVDVDRSDATLYLHALNVADSEQVEQVRESVRSAESWVIRIMGTREEYRDLKAGRLRWQVDARQISSDPGPPQEFPDAAEPRQDEPGSAGGERP